MNYEEFIKEELKLMSFIIPQREFYSLVNNFLSILNKESKQVGWLKQFNITNKSCFIDDELFYIDIDTNKLTFGSYTLFLNSRYTNWEILTLDNSFNLRIKIFVSIKESYLNSLKTLSPNIHQRLLKRIEKWKLKNEK